MRFLHIRKDVCRYAITIVRLDPPSQPPEEERKQIFLRRGSMSGDYLKWMTRSKGHPKRVCSGFGWHELARSSYITIRAYHGSSVKG